LIVDKFPKLGVRDARGTTVAAAAVIGVFIAFMVSLGAPLLDAAIGWPFAWRVILVIVLLAPAGLSLGVFFPLGLQTVAAFGTSATAWAWAINCGFSVLGSILAIIIAQFMGFKAVLLMGFVVYLIAVLSFGKLFKSDR